MLALMLLCGGGVLPNHAPIAAALAQPTPGRWFTNRPAHALAIIADTLYIGGDFTQIGPAVDRFAAFTLDGSYDQSFPQVGTVGAITSDGSGGWYLGRNSYGPDAPQQSHLVHIRADRTVDPAWIPTIGVEVQYLTADADRVYAVSGSMLMAFDRTSSGDPLWFTTINGVTTLTSSGGVLYVGGPFTQVGTPAVVRKYAAAFNSATGALLPWNPNPNDKVWAIAADTNAVYIGGDFTNINGTPRNYIAAIDPASGLLSGTWNVVLDSRATSIVVHNNTVYVGGEFMTANSSSRPHAAAFTTAGVLTLWNPAPNDNVWGLAADGDIVYAGGSFTGGNGSSPAYLAAFDAATGATRSFDAKIDNGVTNLVAGNGRILVKGFFSGVNLIERDHIAAVNRITGQLTSWAPTVDAPVNELLALGSTLYIAGNFTSVDGVLRPRAAAIDTLTGMVTSWNPQPNGTINILLGDGGVVYAGGEFTAVNAPPVTRRFLASFDAETGAVTAWNPNPDGIIYALAKSSSAIYVGGEFVNVGSPAINRIKLASFDRTSGALTPWIPPTGVANGSSVLVIHGTTLYVSYLAIDTTTGALISWSSKYLGRPVQILAGAGDILYGLTSTNFHGFTTYRFVGVDRATGLLATCGSIWDDLINDVLAQDGIVYGIYTPLDPNVTNFVSVIALQPQICGSRIFLPSIL